MPAGVSAWTPLANITLGSTASTVTFSSISGAYRDLVVVINGGFTSAVGFRVQVNSDTGNNYSTTMLETNGSGTWSGSDVNLTQFVSAYNYSTMATSFDNTLTLHFLDYAQTDKHKNLIMRISGPGSGLATNIGRWASTSAVTSILLYQNAGASWLAGSTFALYGVSS